MRGDFDWALLAHCDPGLGLLAFGILLVPFIYGIRSARRCRMQWTKGHFIYGTAAKIIGLFIAIISGVHLVVLILIGIAECI